MTYKAGDKVYINGVVHTVFEELKNGNVITTENPFYNYPSELRPATAVEIAKQAVLDEVNDKSDSVSPILNELLDVLIAKVAVHTMSLAIETYREANTPIPNYESGTPTSQTDPDYIGKTKID